jgi:hypothetical protein
MLYQPMKLMMMVTAMLIVALMLTVGMAVLFQEGMTVMIPN